MRKKHLALVFNMRFIFGLIIASNIVLEARDYMIPKYNSHSNTQTKKLIYSANDNKVECPANRLFNIDIKGTSTILEYMSAINKQCNIVMMIDKNAKRLIQKIPRDTNIKKKNISTIYDALLKPYGMEYTHNKHFLKVFAAKLPVPITEEIATKAPALPLPKKVKHTAPKVYASLGNELEVLQRSCDIYLNLTLINDDIKTKCQAYSQKVGKAFKVGYKLDPYANSDNISQDKLDKYLNLLRSADQDREKLSSFISSKIRQARDEDNIDQYTQLIEAPHIKLSARDYTFMDKHSAKMKNNPMYIRYLVSVKQQKIAIKKERERLKLQQESKRLAMQKHLTGCKEGDSKSCLFIGESYLSNNDTISAHTFFNKACSLGNNVGCERLISTYKIYSKTDNSVKAEKLANNGNYIEAYEIATEECNARNSTHACLELCNITLSLAADAKKSSRKEYDKFINLYKHYKAKGKALMMMEFGIDYYNKRGGRGAKEYFVKPCKMGHQTACKFYKILYNNGY